MSLSPTPTTPFTLRDLPIPAKLVITCFLLAVGGGYTAAMVQLHVQDSKSGEAMPTVQDVILKFTGKKWFESAPPPGVSKLEKLITEPEDRLFSGTGTMSPAFFSKDDGSFDRMSRGSESERKRLRGEREGEQQALVFWAKASAEVRERAYHDDHFTPDAMPGSITPKFKSSDGAVKVKSIIDVRCVRCHGKEGYQSAYPLETYEHVAKYLVVPTTVTVPPGGGWVKIEEPIGIEKLTQSTHAHLLSFAMLFALTGLVFAFTSYPVSVRCIIGPWVLLAVVADVSLWWLARLCPNWGPYFAMGIIGTGGAAGLGLAVQITLSLFNLYGPKGKLAIVLVFLIAAGCAGAVYVEQIEPGLKAKRDKLNAAKADPTPPPVSNKEPEKNDAASGSSLGKLLLAAAHAQKNPVAVQIKPSSMEKVFHLPARGPDGMELPLLKIPFKGNQEGGMVRAFFDKDGAEFSEAVKDKSLPAEELAKLKAERDGELNLFVAWSKLTDSDRRKSYETDAFDVPPTLAGKPLTAGYLAGNRVKVKTLIADRCVRCHSEGGDAEKFPFKSYENVRELMLPAR